MKQGDTGRDAVVCCATGASQSNWPWETVFRKAIYATTKGQEARLEVNELSMLRCGMTRKDMTRNDGHMKQLYLKCRSVLSRVPHGTVLRPLLFQTT